MVLGGTKVGGEVSFNGAAIVGNLEFREAELGASLFCTPHGDHRTVVGGQVVFGGTNVRGDVSFNGAAIRDNLVFQSAKIGERLLCRSMEGNRTVIGGEVSLFGTTVGGGIDVNGAAIAHDLALQKTEVGEDLFCTPHGGNRTVIGGRVLLSGTTVLGTVEMNGASIVDNLDVQDAELGASLFCRPEGGNRSLVGGRMFLSGTKVGGQVDVGGALIAGELALQNAEVGACLFCRPLQDDQTGTTYPTEIKKQLQIVMTQVKGNVDLCGAAITGGLRLRSSVFYGFVQCHPHDGFRARAELVLIEKVTLNGYLDMRGINIEKGLAIIDSSVQGSLRCAESSRNDSPEVWNTDVGSVLLIQRCHINHLNLDGRIIPKPKDNVALPRLRLNQTEVFKLEINQILPPCFDAEGLQFIQLLIPGNDYRTFLHRTRPFFKATYVRFESWLRDRGEEARANAIYRDRRNRDHKEGGMSWANTIFENVLLRPIGYGTKTYQLLLCWFLPVFVLSWLLYSAPVSVERKVGFAPGDLPLVRNGSKLDRSVQPQEWQGPMKPLLMAVQTTLPMLPLASDLGVVPADLPIRVKDDVVLPRWATYQVYAGVVSVGSWIALPLAIAGLSGLIRRKD